MAHKINPVKYRKSQPNQLYNKTENTDYVNTHNKIPTK